jgi:hypothetical protein
MRLSTSSLAKRAMRMCAYAFKLSARPSVLLRLRLMICSMRLSSSALQAGSEMSASSLLSSSSIELVLYVSQLASCSPVLWRDCPSRTHLQAVPSLTYPPSSSSSEEDAGRPRVRLAARDCAGDATAEPALEDAPEATREAVLRDTVLWLSRARLRRSRMVDVVIR